MCQLSERRDIAVSKSDRIQSIDFIFEKNGQT